jgi:hypothetical protein
VVHDRQIVIGRGAPDRFEIGISLTAASTSRAGALIRPFSRFGNWPQKSAM